MRERERQHVLSFKNIQEIVIGMGKKGGEWMTER